MPAKSYWWHDIVKHCEWCGETLTIRNARDVYRRQFCSKQCNGKYTAKYLLDYSKIEGPRGPNPRKGHRGSAHHNWKSDRAALAEQRPAHFLEVNSWRRRVFRRDDWICQRCSKRGGRLQSHHLFPYATHPALRFDENNGVTLCKECHKTIHREQIRRNKKPKRRIAYACN